MNSPEYDLPFDLQAALMALALLIIGSTCGAVGVARNGLEITDLLLALICISSLVVTGYFTNLTTLNFSCFGLWLGLFSIAWLLMFYRIDIVGTGLMILGGLCLNGGIVHVFKALD